MSDEDEVLRRSWETALAEYESSGKPNPVLEKCRYVRFYSYSAGRKKVELVKPKAKSGRRSKKVKFLVTRRYRQERLIELVTYGNKTWQLFDTPRHGLDTVESELMADVYIPPESSVHAEFIKILRSSAKKIARGRKATN